MTDFKISISPELQLLADAKGWDLEPLVERGIIDKLTEVFECGDEITDYDIRNWVKIEVMG